MRFLFLIMVYAHIVVFANPSLSENGKDTKEYLETISGEVKKFSFHQPTIARKKLPVLNGLDENIDLLKEKHTFLLVNFWATWCAPCVKEMPSLNELQGLFEKKSLKIVTVATGRNSPNKISEFFRKYNLENIDNFRDPQGDLAISLGILGLPTTILISPDNHEFARLIGPINWSEPEIIKFFRSLEM